MEETGPRRKRAAKTQCISGVLGGGEEGRPETIRENVLSQAIIAYSRGGVGLKHLKGEGIKECLEEA